MLQHDKSTVVERPEPKLACLNPCTASAVIKTVPLVTAPLQDMTRTGTYHAAITENRADFEGKVVMDVGAGSGILSLFSAQVCPVSICLHTDK